MPHFVTVKVHLSISPTKSRYSFLLCLSILLSLDEKLAIGKVHSQTQLMAFVFKIEFYWSAAMPFCLLSIHTGSVLGMQN